MQHKHTHIKQLNSVIISSAALILGAALLACNMPALRMNTPPNPTPTQTPPPSPTVLPPPEPTPTPTIPAFEFGDGWQNLAAGLDVMRAFIPVDGLSESPEAIVVRIDPQQHEFRVNYEPNRTATVAEWHRRTGARVTINAGFFLPNHETLGILVSEGVRYGASFERTGYAGMMTIHENVVGLRSLGQFPYDPTEPLDHAIQGRPMLLYPGRFPVEFTLSTDLSRRTAVAQDGAGTIYFIIVPEYLVSLYDLRDWLAATETVDFFVAFNLDGGGSTGLALTTADEAILIESRSLVPSVISVHPRSD